MPEMSSFAAAIMQQKYSHTVKGKPETWAQIAHRVVPTVFGAVGAPAELVAEMEAAVAARKFIPAGRYLYASGRPLHQVNNCLTLRADDSREGWADLMQKVTMALMTGAGIGVEYSLVRAQGKPIRRTGGLATGPIALMQMVNETGRHIRQGGARRSAIWAGLNWKHPDITKFIHIKDWSDLIKGAKEDDFNFPAPLDGTNISVGLDDEFFKAYAKEDHPLHSHALSVYWDVIAQMLRTAEPGFTVDVGANKKETLRNAPVCAGTMVLTGKGYRDVKDLVGMPTSVWTGKQFAPDVVFRETNPAAKVVKVTMSNGRAIRCDPSHPFLVDIQSGDVTLEIKRIPAGQLRSGDILHVSMPPNWIEGVRGSFETKVLAVQDDGVEPVYCADVKVEEHTFQAEGVIISNCAEVASEDDSDVCNLGSINLSRVSSLEEMTRLVELGTAFLLAGSVYSDVPYAKVDVVRTKNRRLGLGLMGLHEWLLRHGKTYGPDPDLQKYLEVYATSTEVARRWAEKWDLSPPLKTRSVAPNGTVSIVSETTSGIEPIFCAAYKRRYLKGDVWHYQYVVDPTAKRLIDGGVAPEQIEDAYTLAEAPERRVAFQAWIQKYVDHAISSTINLPEWGSPQNNQATVQAFGTMLLEYLPKLRGITCYPDGARGGQPLTPVRYQTAVKHLGEVFIEQADICDITNRGACGA